MNIFRKKPNKETHSLKLGQKGKKAFAVYAAIALSVCSFGTTVFAASDPLAVINNLSDLFWFDSRDWYDPVRLRCSSDRVEFEIP